MARRGEMNDETDGNIKITLEKRIHLPPKATSATHFAVVIAVVIAEVKIQIINKQNKQNTLWRDLPNTT